MLAYAKPEQKKILRDTTQRRGMEKTASSSNLTGIPDTMKTQFEGLSGFSFADVRVHYNSDKPAQLQALAYTQGNQVYIGPNQEKHLGHELGHVVQQKSNLVNSMTAIGGVQINTDERLEKNADMIDRACQMKGYDNVISENVGLRKVIHSNEVVQRQMDENEVKDEAYYLSEIRAGKLNANGDKINPPKSGEEGIGDREEDRKKNDYYIAEESCQAKDKLTQITPDKPMNDFQKELRERDTISPELMVYGTESDRVEQRIQGLQSGKTAEHIYALQGYQKKAKGVQYKLRIEILLTNILNQSAKKGNLPIEPNLLPKGYVEKSFEQPINVATTGLYTADRFNNYSWRDFESNYKGKKIAFFSIYNPEYNNNFSKDISVIKSDMIQWTQGIVKESEREKILDYQRALLEHPTYSPLATYRESANFALSKEQKGVLGESLAEAKNKFELETRRSCKFGLEYATILRKKSKTIAFLTNPKYEESILSKAKLSDGRRIPITTSELRKLFRLYCRDKNRDFLVRFFDTEGKITHTPWLHNPGWANIEENNYLTYRTLCNHFKITAEQKEAFKTWTEKKTGTQLPGVQEDDYFKAQKKLYDEKIQERAMEDLIVEASKNSGICSPYLKEAKKEVVEREAYFLWKEKGVEEQSKEDAERNFFEVNQSADLEGLVKRRAAELWFQSLSETDKAIKIGENLDSSHKRMIEEQAHHVWEAKKESEIQSEEQMKEDYKKGEELAKRIETIKQMKQNLAAHMKTLSEENSKKTDSELIWIACREYCKSNGIAGYTEDASRGALKKLILSKARDNAI